MKTKIKLFFSLFSIVVAVDLFANISNAQGLELYISIPIIILALVSATIFLSNAIEIIIYRFAVLVSTLMDRHFS